jgi:predicted DNA binding CopG/RHH family protein
LLLRVHAQKIAAMSRTVPEFKTDAEAEAFLDQDLSDLDFSQFRPIKFKLAAKAPELNGRQPPQRDVTRR